MLNRIFRQSGVPRKYRATFLHLYFDIGWFGILSGSAVNFLNIYAARLGASGLQIGLIAAASAVVSLSIAIPAGRWVERSNTNRAVFWSSVFYRIGYALWIPLPWLFGAQGQIWALIVLAFLMAIPLTPLGVGFNTLFAEAVPVQYRAHVAGMRNMVLAFAFMASSFASGYILNHVTFPVGYQIVFGIGFVGAAMSSLHLYFVRPHPDDAAPFPTPPFDFASRSTPLGQDRPEPASASRAESARGLFASMRLDILQGPFRRVLVLLLIFHLAHYIANPLYPLYNVNVLHLNDDNIGTGTALYYLTVLIGSMQLHRIVNRLGHKRVTGWGMVGMAMYPMLLALSHSVWQYYVVSLLGGFTWALAGGAYANYILERIPPADRPSHLAWYNMALNAAVLLSSFIGPAIGDWVGLVYALIIFGLMRVLAGVLLLRWG
jgi:MFS family permease